MTLKWLNAQKEFESWFQTKRSFCFEFHDARIAKGTGGSNRIFTTSHPSDYVVVDDGVMFYAEVKSSHELVSFPFGCVQKGQWSAAKRTVSANGSYFFFLKNENSRLWYRVPAFVLLEIYDAGVRSVKWEHLKPLEYKR